MLKIFLASILNHLSLLKLKINSFLCSCTIHVFRLTDNKPFVLPNVGSKKKFFSKNGQVNQQASADRPVSSLLGLVRTLQLVVDPS